MSITTKLSALLASTLLLLASSGAFADGIPGSIVPESGNQGFLNNVTVRANRGTWTISGKDGFKFFDGSGGVWDGSNGQYRLSVSFDSNGDFLSGDLSLKGKIPTLLTGNGPQLLLTANVISFDFDSTYSDTLIGFGIENIDCNLELGIGDCHGYSESIWITLDSAYLDDPNARFRNSGYAITTVPVPAAVWLFGSGLIFLSAAARKRRAA